MSPLNLSVRQFLARPKVAPVVVFVGMIVTIWLIQEEFNATQVSSQIMPFTDWQNSLKRLGLSSATFATALLLLRPGRSAPGLVLLFGLLIALEIQLVLQGNNAAKALLVVPIVARYFMRLEWNLALLVFSLLLHAMHTLYLVMFDPADQYNMLFFVQYYSVMITEMALIYTAYEAVVSNEVRGRALDMALNELKDSRAAQLIGAAMSERSALSRELHDTMGHELAALRLEVQRARKLEQRSAAPTPEVLAALDNAMLRSASALEQLQEVVSTLRTPDLDGTLYQALQDLLVTWPGQASLHLQGPEPDLPMPTKLTLYRAVQESLTNAQKYAPNQPVTVNIASTERELRLTVTNTKASLPQPSLSARRSGNGTGLNSLSERIADLGGTLTSHNLEEEFSVCLTIPLINR